VLVPWGLVGLGILVVSWLTLKASWRAAARFPGEVETHRCLQKWITRAVLH
jgi:hypothetical protein